MLQRLPAPLAAVLPTLLSLLTIWGARALTHTAWAEANAGWAAILFAWVVTDALMLVVIWKARDRKPDPFHMLAVLSLASVVVIAGAAAPVQAVYLGFPEVLLAAAMTLAIFLGWSSLRIAKEWRAKGSIMAGLERVLPAALLRFAQAELRVLVLGLFRWGAPADVPAGSRPFIYHTYLTPMVATFLALQVIEISVVHLLLMLWSPTLAWVLFALSIWGIIWTVALLKSFRINPVLVTGEVVRVRSGMLYDFEVPIHQIADASTAFTSEELQDKSVLNLALMSAPNVSLRFENPVVFSTALGGEKRISGVGLRLDDSAGFLEALRR
ncbi:hypothetical protein NAP1_08050 [Erythrobacter sp. NAP1]|uniref:hypothetical protein n=1 Tax=Erythrobacter sp. NAP1 TaxID=237727 RepID=UPI0000686E36|nr:hypothetical protein [Erythrobacter sp. NAP1]EAQ30716.1 hypothetical protein NAP1_08050 [Erythrobacter sp. NAP1]